MPEIICHHCGDASMKDANAINRAKREGLNLYCDRKCSGLGRRKGKTTAVLVEEKRLYDMAYRKKNAERLQVKKKEYFERTYDPVAAAIVRKRRMPYHVAYCRTPEYRKKKTAYDKIHKAKKNYGEFWEAFLLSQDITAEALEHATRYDIAKENGTLNKAKRRRLSHE